jgi:hypothetical protein
MTEGDIVKAKCLTAGILIGLFCTCQLGLNRSISVKPNRNIKGSPKSINGNVKVGHHARIYGSCTSINGSVEVGRGAMTRGVLSVNGGVTL